MSGMSLNILRSRQKQEGIGSNCAAKRFLNQDFQTLREHCLQTGSLFQDNSFPASPSSLGFKELAPNSYKTRDVVWRRPREICSNPQFFIEGATRTDICQGALGDCWLLAAIASLTLNEEILNRVVPSGQCFGPGYCGIFHFQCRLDAVNLVGARPSNTRWCKIPLQVSQWRVNGDEGWREQGALGSPDIRGECNTATVLRRS
ncbi:calpain-2 catalytic subunit-like [Scyliorhinus torazame]|uniref:calpain-2 catalytic subunit-like n=1 Tax=Scyliorhinus torazame TaxID=75743 RepID=UPI003B5C9192